MISLIDCSKRWITNTVIIDFCNRSVTSNYRVVPDGHITYDVLSARIINIIIEICITEREGNVIPPKLFMLPQT